jgi:hypothetical protein
LVLSTNIGFKVPLEDLFNTKEEIIHPISSLSFAHYYSAKICIDFALPREEEAMRWQKG